VCKCVCTYVCTYLCMYVCIYTMLWSILWSMPWSILDIHRASASPSSQDLNLYILYIHIIIGGDLAKRINAPMNLNAMLAPTIIPFRQLSFPNAVYAQFFRQCVCNYLNFLLRDTLHLIEGMSL